jgi:hypothetical protein
MLIYSEPSPFPPSFEGDPVAFLFGLFGDVVASGMALAMLCGMVFETRRGKQVSNLVGNRLSPPPMPKWSLLYIHRTFVIGVLLFILMRTLPDAAWMLLWGEVSESTIRMLLRADLLLDGLALFPFFMALICWAWTRQTIPQRLYTEVDIQMPRLRFQVVAQNAKILIIVLIIAIGVTVGKANA